MNARQALEEFWLNRVEQGDSVDSLTKLMRCCRATIFAGIARAKRRRRSSENILAEQSTGPRTPI